MTGRAIISTILFLVAMVMMIIIILSVFGIIDLDSRGLVSKKYRLYSDSIEAVVASLQDLDYPVITIGQSDFPYTFLRVYYTDCAKIQYIVNDDSELQALLKSLINNKGCEQIKKENDILMFQFISNLDDSKGILVTLNDQKPPSNTIAGIKLLTEEIAPNTYYYETKLKG